VALSRLPTVETARLKTFGDGDHAITTVPVVLLLDVPDVSGGQSPGHVLRCQWPSHAGATLSSTL
jgi:hypothetical protein